MKQLKCEMCGSTDLIKQDGMFVCQVCGTKYSVEEAKKMMIEGTVRVDNSHMVENYLTMAKTAQEAGNYTEAELYCNKVIEIEPTNYKAWMLKGEAVAWQSTLQNPRIDEGVTAFVKAINQAPKEEKAELMEEAKDEIKKLSLAMISLRADRFAKWPDKEESEGFVSDISAILNTVVTFLTQTGGIVPISEIMAPVATQINQSVVKAWQNVIWPDYNGDPNDPDDKAGKYEWQTFIKRVDYCIDLVEKAIKICKDDDEEDIQRYENIIFMQKAAIDSCSWVRRYTSYGNYWAKEWSLAESAKHARRQLISQYESKIQEIKDSIATKKAEEQAARRAAYWASHKEEKEKLDKELSQLQEAKKQYADQIAELQKQRENLPIIGTLNELQNKIVSLTEQKKALGLFKIKEKKTLQDQIDGLEKEKAATIEQIRNEQDEIEKEIKPIKKELGNVVAKINEIETELTKDR